MSQREFLLEVGTEEIPDWMIAGALGDLEKRFLDALAKNDLAEGVICQCDATPRRLVLVAEGLAERQADREEVLKGPPKNVAFDADGKPTKAAEGFAKRAGVSLNAVDVLENEVAQETPRELPRRPADSGPGGKFMWVVER